MFNPEQIPTREDDWEVIEGDAPLISEVQEAPVTQEFIEKYFHGPDAEVTVTRNPNKDHSEKWREGGWRVAGLDGEKPGNVVVCGPAGEKKSMDAKRLFSMQPFQEQDKVSVWVISSKLKDGKFVVKGEKDGQKTTETLTKSDLIKAQIAVLRKREDELSERRKGITGWGDVVAEDRPILDDIDQSRKKVSDEIKYWQDKLAAVTRLAGEFQE